MILAPSLELTFIHIHKTGGSSLERCIEPHLMWSDLILGSSDFGEKINEAFNQRFGLHKHSSVSDIESICGSKYVDEYYCFAFVRHPIDRVCSLYNFTASVVLGWAGQQGLSLHKLRQRMNEGTLPASLNWATSQAFVTTDTFSGYIRSEHLWKDMGFQTQASRLRSRRDATIRADAFRIEDQQAWQSRLSIKLGLSLTLTHDNKSRLRLVEAASLCKGDTEYLSNVFEEDFHVFGY